MSLRINTVVCSLVVLLTIGQIATAGPTIPAAQNEMMEAMKSGDSARIQKAAKALTEQRGATGNAGMQKAHTGGGMPALSAADQKLLASPQGKQILAKHDKLREKDPEKADEILRTASNAKIEREQKRDPNIVMKMLSNPMLQQVALVEHYPNMEREQKAQASAEEHAKAHRYDTPNYDNLYPFDQVMVRWAVNKEYREMSAEGKAVIQTHYKDLKFWEARTLERRSLNLADGLLTLRLGFLGDATQYSDYLGSDKECEWLYGISTASDPWPNCEEAVDKLHAIKARKAGSSQATVKNPMVKLHTNLGVITIQLDAIKSPRTVKNFEAYIVSGFYNNTMIHGVEKQYGGGGYGGTYIFGGVYGQGLVAKKADSPSASANTPNTAIKSESSEKFQNKYTVTTFCGGVSMPAFVINLQQMSIGESGSSGYCIIGKITEGWSVADKIGRLKTHKVSEQLPSVPTEEVIVTKAEIVQ